MDPCFPYYYCYSTGWMDVKAVISEKLHQNNTKAPTLHTHTQCEYFFDVKFMHEYWQKNKFDADIKLKLEQQQQWHIIANIKTDLFIFEYNNHNIKRNISHVRIWIPSTSFGNRIRIIPKCSVFCVPTFVFLPPFLRGKISKVSINQINSVLWIGWHLTAAWKKKSIRTVVILVLMTNMTWMRMLIFYSESFVSLPLNLLLHFYASCFGQILNDLFRTEFLFIHQSFCSNEICLCRPNVVFPPHTFSFSVKCNDVLPRWADFRLGSIY